MIFPWAPDNSINSRKEIWGLSNRFQVYNTVSLPSTDAENRSNCLLEEVTLEVLGLYKNQDWPLSWATVIILIVSANVFCSFPLSVWLCKDPRDCLCGASSCQGLWQTQGRRQGRQCCQPHQASLSQPLPLSCTCRLRSRPPHWVSPPTPSYSCRLRNRLHTEPPPPSCTCRLRSRCPCTPGASHTPCWGTDLNTHSSHASGSWGLARSSPQWLCSGNEQKREDTETCQISV